MAALPKIVIPIEMDVAPIVASLRSAGDKFIETGKEMHERADHLASEAERQRVITIEPELRSE